MSNFIEELMFGNEPQNHKGQRKVYKFNEQNQKYDLYEMKGLTIEQLRQGYKEITGLDNDNEFTDEEIYNYILEALKE